MASSSARRWTCVYTKDIHKKQKHRKKYEDGVLDVWEDQNNKTRLFAADDDGNPKGEALAFGNLSAREISALVDGDDIRIEGYDVTPEEEQGAGGDTKATGAAVANPPFAPRVTIARPRAVTPAASMANIRKPFNQPFKPPAFTARPKAMEEPPAYKAARMSPEPEDTIDEEAAARELDAYWAQIRAARAESGRTAGGFDDLYEEARRENPGDASLRPTLVERAVDPSSSKKATVPLAQRKSKWAVYAGGDTHKAKEEPEPEISGFAAAIQAAGGGGDPLSALARLGAGGDTEPRARDDVPTATTSALERWGDGASTAQGQRWTGADITNEVTAPFAAVVPTQQRRQVPLKPAASPQNLVINPTELNLGFPSKDDLSALRFDPGSPPGVPLRRLRRIRRTFAAP